MFNIFRRRNARNDPSGTQPAAVTEDSKWVTLCTCWRVEAQAWRGLGKRASIGIRGANRDSARIQSAAISTTQNVKKLTTTGQTLSSGPF